MCYLGMVKEISNLLQWYTSRTMVKTATKGWVMAFLLVSSGGMWWAITNKFFWDQPLALSKKNLHVPGLPCLVRFARPSGFAHTRHCERSKSFQTGGVEEQMRLFLAVVRPHKLVCSSTLAKWPRTLSDKAGIVFEAHSTTGAKCGVCLWQRPCHLWFTLQPMVLWGPNLATVFI